MVSDYRALTATMSDAPSHAGEAAREWTQLPGGVVDGGEIVIFAVKPSMWRPVFDALPWLLTATFFALVLTTFRLSVGALGTALSAQVVLMVAIARLGFAIVRWVPTWYLLTNRRVITVQGVRTPRVTSRALLAIRNTYVHASSLERWVDAGAITFVSDHPQDVALTWHSVPHPEQIHQRIRRAIESAIDQHGLGT